MNRLTLKRRLVDAGAELSRLQKQVEQKQKKGVSLRAFKAYYGWSFANPDEIYSDERLQNLVDNFFTKFNQSF